MTPVHVVVHGSEPVTQPVKPAGQPAVTADLTASRPVVWAQSLPSSVELVATVAVVHEPGSGPHSAALPVAMSRPSAVMPTGHAEGI